MNIKETMEYIHDTTWKGSCLGLSRIKQLLELQGNPHEKLKFIHVAGMNGKGSTAAMIASILKEAGCITGLYTSPFIRLFGERIQVDFGPISDDEIAKLAERIRF